MTPEYTLTDMVLCSFGGFIVAMVMAITYLRRIEKEHRLLMAQQRARVTQKAYSQGYQDRAMMNLKPTTQLQTLTEP